MVEVPQLLGDPGHPVLVLGGDAGHGERVEGCDRVERSGVAGVRLGRVRQGRRESGEAGRQANGRDDTSC